MARISHTKLGRDWCRNIMASCSTISRKYISYIMLFVNFLVYFSFLLNLLIIISYHAPFTVFPTKERKPEKGILNKIDCQ